MTDSLYLIAHLCRGEPTFDIAVRQSCGICQGVGGHMVPDFETGVTTDYEGSPCVECDGLGYWWILATPGYRAYPWWTCRVQDLSEYQYTGKGYASMWNDVDHPCKFPPADAIDVFACNDRPSQTATPTGAKALLAKLGLIRPSAPIKRRL